MSKRKGRRPRGSGGITERKDGRLYATFVLPSGSRLGKYFRDRDKADGWLLETAYKARQGDLPEASHQTVAQYLTRWLADCVHPPMRAYNTWVAQEGCVRLHIVPVIGRVKLSALTPQHVQRMLASMAARGFSPSRQKSVRIVLSGALNRAVRWGLIARNPVALVDSPRVTRAERSYIAAADLQRYLDAFEGHRLAGLLRFIVGSGLREGEALGLSWGNVSIEAGTVSVRRQLQRIEGAPELVAVKRPASLRTVPLPPFALQAVREQKARQKADRMAAGEGWVERGLVWTRPDGSPLSPPMLRNAVRRMLGTARLPRVTIHELRHSYASMLLNKDASLKDVQELLGHASVRTTADLYGHVTAARKSEVVGRLQAILDG